VALVLISGLAYVSRQRSEAPRVRAVEANTVKAHQIKTEIERRFAMGTPEIQGSLAGAVTVFNPANTRVKPPALTSPVLLAAQMYALAVSQTMRNNVPQPIAARTNYSWVVESDKEKR
jgi:hypothetical protein